MFSFSTCWNSDHSEDGEAMLDAIRELGFSRVELSHGIRLSLLEGIERAMKLDSKLEVSSVHNFCPLPVGFLRSNPNIYLLSSLNESERKRAIRQTLETLDFAAKVRAKKVVLHLGKVERLDLSQPLLKLIQNGKRNTREYADRLHSGMEKRARLGRQYLERVMHSLGIVVEKAREVGVMLGVECRHMLEEIPTEKEALEIFKAFGGEHLGYWHDCGHAQTQHNLGVVDHAIMLERFEPRLIGSHVHDLDYPHHDHKIPGKGTIPFEQLNALKNPRLLKVFEFSPGTPAEELRESLPLFMKSLEG